ncbi:MAG TPA: hypothetical protein VJ044_02235 [Candidatus Hodarchaeales archaeon]|nr:hypothetical protein [Candidatus Hodarchaeales archaeon]
MHVDRDGCLARVIGEMRGEIESLHLVISDVRSVCDEVRAIVAIGDPITVEEVLEEIEKRLPEEK